jgi:two-component sensor histidine kinase
MYKLRVFCMAMCLAVSALGQINNADTVRAMRSRLSKSLTDINRIKLQLDLGNLYLFLSAKNQKNTDSVLILCEQATYLSDKLHLDKWEKECLKLKGYYYFETGDLKNGKACYKQVIEKYDNLRDQRKIAQEWINRGHFMPLWNLNLREGQVACFEEAKNIYKRLNDKQDEINAFKEEADAHFNEGKLDLAEKELFQILAEYKAIHYRKLHNTYFLLAALYGLKGDLHKQLFYSLETVKSMEATSDTANAMAFYFKLASVYRDLSMYDNSLYYFKKSFVITSRGDQYWYYEVMNAIIRVLIDENKKEDALVFFKKNNKSIHAVNYIQQFSFYAGLMDCYIALGSYKTAEPYVEKLLNISNNFTKPGFANMSPVIVRSYYRACDIYLHVGDIKRAKFYLQKLLTEPKELISPLILSNVELFKFKIDSASGNYISGIKHFELYKKLTDSIFNATKSKQIAELQISYETGQKDKDIQLLKKQSLIEQGRLESKKMIGNLALGGLALLLILLGVLYNRYQLKKRNISLLQEKHKEISTKNITLEQLLHDNEWLLREVHHRVKNNLQIVMSLLHSQSAYLKDEVALHAVMDSQHRVQAMSLIHQKLYKSDNATSIYMPEYISELIDYLKDSFKTELSVFFSLDIAPIFLDVLHAVPVGLILNEIITNALKYAFPHTENDTITVRLFCAGDGEVSLYIADNGRGLPKGFDIENTNSFGMLLVKGLIEDLGGAFIIQSINGTVLTTNFNIVPLTESELIIK